MPETNGEKPNFYTLFQNVGRMEGKLDEALKSLKEQGDRLNCVEKVQDQMVGKISILGAIAGFIGGIITSILKGKYFQ